MHSTPQQHPFRRLEKGLDTDCKRYKTPLEITATELKSLRLDNLETILPYCTPPWQARPNIVINDRERAIHEAVAVPPVGARNTSVDGSVRDDKVGIADFSKMCNGNGKWTTRDYTKTIGYQSCLTAQYAELVALEAALDFFTSSWDQSENQGLYKLSIYSDCKSALQALQNPHRQSGQYVLKRILESSRLYSWSKDPRSTLDGYRPMQKWKETKEQTSLQE